MIAGADHGKVSRYNKDGWVEDLSDFPDARTGHACVTYTENNGNKVSEVLKNILKSQGCQPKLAKGTFHYIKHF